MTAAPDHSPDLSPDLEVPVAIVGGGPAGLMAAEVLSGAGVPVHLFDAMPSVGRKFLLAGKGGMNLTHSESADRFSERYGARRGQIEALLREFGAAEVRAWAAGLGIETFVGSSGRVFPTDMKAAPLLRAWLQRLRHPTPGGAPVQFHMRHRWTGWAADGQTLCFDSPTGPIRVRARALLLALGGGSWARLGSNGAWVPLLAARGVAVAPLLPSNCGFDIALQPLPAADGQALPLQVVPTPPVGWSEHFVTRHAGQPFKNVVLRFANGAGAVFERKGECVATATDSTLPDDPRFGKWGKQKCEDTGPLTTKRMETFDGEVAAVGAQIVSLLEGRARGVLLVVRRAPEHRRAARGGSRRARAAAGHRQALCGCAQPLPARRPCPRRTLPAGGRRGLPEVPHPLGRLCRGEARPARAAARGGEAAACSLPPRGSSRR